LNKEIVLGEEDSDSGTRKRLMSSLSAEAAGMGLWLTEYLHHPQAPNWGNCSSTYDNLPSQQSS